MGVPSFYRWLVDKYPKIVSNAVEEEGENLDISSPIPNGLEFDNFYLDMNGIIHPCFHPDDNIFSPTTFDEVFNSMYEYIDRLINIVRPRKLLFMAIDGVAPRAKMNQQRARRFRASKDAQMAEEMEDKLRKQFGKEGKTLFPKQESQVSDSNVVTPGTEFMHMLSQNLQSYISLRMKENPAWRRIKVILSDDTVPGEGEHKIMSFIRAQRLLPGYDPNTRHCLYGLDADLIMLALATHEIHFSILREEVLSSVVQESALGFSKSRVWFKEHPWQQSRSESVIVSENSVSSKETTWGVKKRQLYQFLNVWVLREYLALDMKIPNPPEKLEYDIERIVDDFIFICFFAGNDFLPHMPSLEIHEGCIDLLMHVYKKEFQSFGGYLVDMQRVDDKKGGYIKLKRVERFVLSVGTYEEKIFSKRLQIRERKLRQILAEYRDAKDDEKNNLDDGCSSDIVISSVVADVGEGLKISASAADFDTLFNNTKELKQKLRDNIRDQSDLFKNGAFGTDKVKLGTPGWRDRYYMEKFSVESPNEIEATRKDVVAKYGEGLCWAFLYYYSGVPSWTWFYPYHYGPFASDVKGLSQIKVKFEKGLPFKPFDQLMGVLPPKSAHALPLAYGALMIDKNSNIIDFYPTDFGIDFDGKRFTWQGISKLPFVEEERLLMETRKLENDLKDNEKVRNLHTVDRLFVSKTSQQVVLSCKTTASKKIKDAIVLDSAIEGVKGTIHLMPDDCNEADDDDDGKHPILCMFYEIPQGLKHIPRLLEGINIPDKTVNEDDIVETVLWHDRHGSNGNRFRNQIPGKPERKLESGSQNAAPIFISKGVGRGCGFSLGRGKSNATLNSEGSYNFQKHRGGELERGSPQMSSSSRQNRGTRSYKPMDTNCKEYWRPKEGSSRRDEDYRTIEIESQKMSDLDPCQISNNKPRQSVSKSLVSHDDWQVNKPLRTAPMSNYHGTSEDRQVNKPLRGATVGSWQRNFGDGSGQTQCPFPTNTIRGRGRGRGRGEGRGF